MIDFQLSQSLKCFVPSKPDSATDGAHLVLGNVALTTALLSVDNGASAKFTQYVISLSGLGIYLQSGEKFDQLIYFSTLGLNLFLAADPTDLTLPGVSLNLLSSGIHVDVSHGNISDLISVAKTNLATENVASDDELVKVAEKIAIEPVHEEAAEVVSAPTPRVTADVSVDVSDVTIALLKEGNKSRVGQLAKPSAE